LIHNRVKYGELKLAIATNQQGIAFELYSLDDVLRIHRIFLSTIGYSETLFPIYICPHAEGSCDCRKPRSGLLRQSIINSGFKKSEAIFFGDSLSDQLAAQDLNIPFVQIARSEDETFFADTVFFDFKEILEIID
jgi:D-glycero-D-manno-heptose 1,7-bisphosphate phosphatase